MSRHLLIIFILSFFIFASQDKNFSPDELAAVTSEGFQTEQIAIPLLLNYQGKLTDNVGNPVRDSSYSITFRLFTTPTGGTAFWSETQTIQTIGGLFHTLLGSVNPIISLPMDGNCYLEMQVNPHPPMSPRIRIVSSAYSYIAKRADTANYAQNASLQRPITPPITSNEISDNAVTSAKILDWTIVGNDINQMGASVGQVLKWTGYTWAPANDNTGGLPSGPAGGDLTGEYPNPVIANDAINSAKILDGSIQNADIADNAITSEKILDGTIVRADVADDFKAPYADTADYVRYAPAYVDSAGGASRVGGLNLTDLDSRFVNEGQMAGGDLTGAYPNPIIAENAINSEKILDGAVQNADIADNAVTLSKIADNTITSAKIVDGTITRSDVANDFKAPYADTADYVRYAPTYVDSARVAGDAYKLQGKDTSYFAPAIHTHPYVDSAGGAERVGGLTIFDLDDRFINEYQEAGGDLTGVYPSPTIANGAVTSEKILDGTIQTEDIADEAITSEKIQDGTIVRADVADDFKAPYADTADYVRYAPAYVDSAGGASRVGGLDLNDLDNRFINEEQPAGGDLTGEYPNPIIAENAINSEKILDGTIQTEDIADNAITSSKIQDGTIIGEDINQMGATAGQVLKWTGTGWMPQDDISDNAWIRVGSDSVIYTIRPMGISRGGVGNVLYGEYNYSHVNFGNACTTGLPNFSVYYSTVSGGYGNAARGAAATIGGGLYNKAGYISTICGGNNNIAENYGVVGGGVNNVASGDYATVGGGYCDTASGWYATVSGGYNNKAIDAYAIVGGGSGNTASYSATVSGGMGNVASGYYSAIGGGTRNIASGYLSTVSGGYANTANNYSATVSGGEYNTASGQYATVAGGYFNISAGEYSFTTNLSSAVPSYYSNSAAFNGTIATASTQLRCGILAKVGGSFTIDHPLDPYNKILNHYFVEGPEMLNIYRGSVILDANGRAEVRLPDYFSALNRNPHIQLTGVGTSDVYVLEDVKDNRFVIGGKPGTKVYWIVTGERQDVSAEVIRRLMPVEQEKTGELRGRMFDDEFLSGCMEQLEREGKATGINFRTAEGRKRYEDMKRIQKEREKKIEK